MINRIDQKEKDFLKIRKRLDEIGEIKRSLPWRELEKPEHCGWEVNFTLNKKGLANDKADKMLRVITACDRGYTLKMDKADIVSKIRQDRTFESIRPLFMTDRSLDGRLVYNGPGLTRLTEKEFNELPEDLQRHNGDGRGYHFYFVEKVTPYVNKWGGAQHLYKTYHPYISPDFLSVEVRKKIVTHVQDIDPKLISEKKFLDDQLEEYWRKRGGHRRWQDRKVPRSRVNEAARKVVKGELDDIHNYKKLNRQKW